MFEQFFAKAKKEIIEAAGGSGALDGLVIGSAGVKGGKFEQGGALDICRALEKLQVSHSLFPQSQSKQEWTGVDVIHVTRGVTSVIEFQLCARCRGL